MHHEIDPDYVAELRDYFGATAIRLTRDGKRVLLVRSFPDGVIELHDVTEDCAAELREALADCNGGEGHDPVATVESRLGI
jgi:hypothetical protein